MDCAGQGADHARRRARCARPSPTRSRRACRRSPSCSCTPTATPRTSSGSRRSSRRAHPQLFVTASHELSQEYREFERTSTAAANAYVGPARAALSRRDGRASRGRRVRRRLSDRAIDRRTVRRRRRRRVPASGCWNPGRRRASSAPRRCATASGLTNAIAFDMGGTTAKAGVIHDGEVLMTGSALIGGYATGLPVQIPMIDIQEVGTGGGSIARVEMGALHVGPESAGAAARPGLLRARRQRADHHRRQSHSRAARRRPLSRRRDAARPRRRQARAGSARRHAARPRSHRRRPTASCASPPPRCPTWCAGSPPSAASMPPISPSSPMAAPGRCMRRWSRASCASPRS